jgi:hypothetical protein
MKKSVATLFILGLLIPTLSAFAKGGFDYIAVRGPGLTGEVNITDPALTQDFFVFADFLQGPIDPPADPGEGYEIVRVNVIVENEKPTPTPFDLLYYYPYTGYVYYQGLVNGSSEYDGKWYTANPTANDPFRAALAQRTMLTWIPFAVLAVILVWFFVAYKKKPNSIQDGEV